MPISAPSRIHLVPVVNKVMIFWNDPDIVEAKRYVIQRSPTTQGAFATIHTKNPVSTSQGPISQERSVERQYDDIGLAAGTYDYRIRSEANGEFMVSNVFTVTIGGGVDYHVVQAGGQDVTGRNGSLSQPWATAQYAMSRVTEGQQHRINVTGSYDWTSGGLMLKRGVSVRGTSRAGFIINYNRNTSNRFDGAFVFGQDFSETSINDLNAEYSEFTINGGNKTGRFGMILRCARGWKITNIKTDRLLYSGIEPRTRGEFFRITGCEVNGCGYTPPTQSADTWVNEGNAFHSGGIWTKGTFNDFFYDNLLVDHAEGYGLKYSPSYEQLYVAGDYETRWDVCKEHILHSSRSTKSSIRPWNGSEAPEFFIEAWVMETQRFLTHNNDTLNQFSLEHKNADMYRAPAGGYSIAVYDSNLKSMNMALIECSNSDIHIDNTILDFRNCAVLYDAFGDYNFKPNAEGPDNVRFTRNLVHFGPHPNPLVGSANRYKNLKILNNTCIYQTTSRMFINIVNQNNRGNDNWTGLEVRNLAIHISDPDQTTMMFVRRTNYVGYFDDGNGIANLSGAQFSNITINRALVNLPVGASFTNITNAVPQFAGGSDIRQMYRPLAAGNLVDTGIQTNLPFAGASPDRGYAESGMDAGVGNQLPQIVVAPLAASITQGTSIIVNYTVTDSDGTVANTKLVVNGVETETDSVAPFAQFIITAPVAGTYQVAVRATDNQGGVSTSVAQTVVVRGANTNPTITLGSLSSQYPTGSTISLSATVADADGLVSKVEFFSNNVKIGERIGAPYVFNYTPPSNGAYAFKAIVTDNDNATADSAVINVTVVTLQEVFSWGMNLGGRSQLLQAPELIVDNKKFEAYDPAVLKSGVAWDYPVDPVLIPDVTGTKNQFLRTSVSSNPSTPVSLEFPRPNALYNAYVYVMEDNAADPFDLVVQGINVLDNHIINGIGTAGQWQMLGPFTANVTDGIFRVTGLDGSVNIAAVELRSLGSQIQVALSQPANVVAGQSLTLTANVTLVPGQSVTKVEFYNGAVKLGEDLTSPYTYLWAGLVAGTYQLTARVIDSNNVIINSQPIELVVSPANQAPVVAFLTNTNLNLFEGSAVEINGTASDDKALSKIELFNGTLRVGEAIGNSNDPNSLGTWMFVVTGLAIGTYTFTAKATDSDGLSTVSAPIILVVRRPVIKNRRDKYSYLVQSPDYILVRFKKYIGLS